MAKLNKYERRVMRGLHVIVVYASLASITAIVFSFLVKQKLTLFFASQLLIIGVYYIRAAVFAFNTQVVPIAMALFIRIMQGLLFVLWFKDTTLRYICISIGIDIVYAVLLFVDKLRYKYEFVPIEEQEW